MNRLLPCLIYLASPMLASVAPLAAQSTAAVSSGTIVGRVLNPQTKDFVRYAEVSVQGTSISAVSEVGGLFRLSNVPAGSVTVVVTYPGFATATAAVNVVGGQTATADFELTPSTDASAKDPNAPVELATFIVASEREGNAKALQQQRNSMNVGRAVATDIYGSVTEGNVGEFLKYLPGVELEYVEADTRGPRLGGMGSEYTSVTMDGMKLASADAFTQYVAFENTAAGGANRSFGFEQVSINSIESIEVNRVTSAAMDADAPAGNINMKMKRAFDSKGRRITWNAGTTLNTEEFHLHKSPGPNDSEGYKFKPNYGFNYSDVFFNQRLGVLIGVSESNLYNEQYRVDHTYNRTTTATDLRPQVLTQILLKDGPKWTERFTTTFSADFRATEALTLSLSVTFNSYDARFYNRQVTMQASGNNVAATTGRQNVSGDGVLTYGTTTGSTDASRQIVFGGGNGIKLTNTLNIIPKFEYRWRDLLVDGAYAYSHSRNDYDNLVRGTVGNSSVNNLTGIGFTASRSGADEADWHFTQTAGADWANLANLKNPRISDDNRQALNDVNTGELNVKYTTPFRLPTFLKIGAKVKDYHYVASNSNPFDVWSYVGPGGNTATTTTGSFANFPTPFVLFGDNQVGIAFNSLSGGGAPAFPNRDALGALFKSNPEYFLRTETLVNATAYEQGKYTNGRDLTETISAGYFMANTRIGKLQVQGGWRYEQTEIESNEVNPRSPTEILASGFPATAAGVPTTWAGMDYKYASKPRITRKGDYGDFFPSVAGKYSITHNLLADLGWGRTIKRPNIGLLSGVWSIDDVNETVTASNPNLGPERSEKVAGSLSYYFGKNGGNNLQMVLSTNTIKALQNTRVYTAEEFGNTDPTYDTYEFVSFSNQGNAVRFRSMELSYVQSLSFLPGALRGLSLNSSYTRTYASERRAGLVPHSVKGGLSYRYKAFNASFNGVWRDESPWFQGTTNRFLKANTKYDLSLGYRVAKNVTLYVQGRNIFEEPHRIYERGTDMVPVLFRYENYGTNWSVGVNGTF